MARAVVAVVAVLAALAPSARAGGADQLAEARRLKAALEWEAALGATDRALAAGDSDPATVAELYALAGELAAGLGRDGDAVAHFERLLALRPDATLPAGTSPTITAPFDRARASAANRRAFSVRGVRGEAGAGADTVVVVIDSDPLGMAAGARARWIDDTGPHEVVARGTGRIELAAPATAELAALDVHGNALWVGTAPAAVEPKPPQVVAIDYARPAPWTRFELWGIVALGSAVVAGVSAWRLDVAQDEWRALRAEDGEHDYTELVAVEERGRRHAFTANAMFALAGVTAVVATALLFRERRIDARRPHEVVVGVTDHGLQLGVAGRF